MTNDGLPPDPAAPADAPAPEAPQVEEDRLGRIEKSVEGLTNILSQALTRETPPTTANDEDAQARQYREQLESEAATNPVLQRALTISQGLYQHMQAENAQLRARLDINEIDDPEERKLTKAAWASGDFRTVEAAQRAVRGDLREKQPAPKPKPDLEEQRRQVETLRDNGTTQPRAVGAPDFKKRMTDNDYLSKLDDPNLSMDEKVKLRRERAGIR